MHLITALITAALSLIHTSADNAFVGGQEEVRPQRDTIITVTIAAAGDLMCHSVQYNYARVSADSFDFTPVYREVKGYLNDADITIGNLETVTAGRGKGYSGYPFFNSPDEFTAALKYAGFDLLTTANNHSLDKGKAGLLRTIEIISKYGMHQTGTYTSPADRDSIRIIDLKGIKTAFLAYTYGTNGIPVPEEHLINLIDYGLIEKDIKQARARGAELVVVNYHFGEEYQRAANRYQKEAVNAAAAAGADLIIGGHPHVIQPGAYFKTNGASIDSGFAAYSLGNFISNQQWRYSDAGVILYLDIKKDTANDSIWLAGVRYTPTWVYRGSVEGKREYIIIPESGKEYGFMNESQKFKMRQAFADTDSILVKYGASVQKYIK